MVVIHKYVYRSIMTAPTSLRVLLWHLPYNWGKSTEKPARVKIVPKLKLLEHSVDCHLCLLRKAFLSRPYAASWLYALWNRRDSKINEFRYGRRGFVRCYPRSVEAFTAAWISLETNCIMYAPLGNPCLSVGNQFRFYEICFHKILLLSSDHNRLNVVQTLPTHVS